MDLFSILRALFVLALPVAVISWFLFNSLYSKGEIDRDLGLKAVRVNLKKLKQVYKEDKSANKDYIFRRWMSFGGGFYGVAGMWTFAKIEVLELLSFIFLFPGFAKLFENGVIRLIVDLAINQFANFIAALLWFSHWPRDSESTLVWVLIAYLGYLLGMHLARRGHSLDDVKQSLKRAQLAFKQRK
ncbi:MAG: hypothetical protein COC19_05400 [SAR86 cluster bacterium]|uniref:Uncharacterized protein n=1 Tax=SAR86 cluster bacterium TaxID=2030880 RepID=A0A2A4ML61_9GAMM|nr:MAG: hypothetical protein COC19_05400 [SAR86 cluster bacterium]